MHASTVDKLLESVRSLFELCAEYDIKLQPAKCTLFTLEVRSCSHLISADSIRYGPHGLNGLLSMEPPSTGAHLQHFFCALQWVM